MATHGTLPQELASLLPSAQARASAEELEGDRWIVAGDDALVVVGPQGVSDTAMWYQVQYVRWQADTRRLLVVWVDPQRTPLVARTASDDLADFMADVTVRVTHALVVQKTVTTDSGTRITAAVRRREDGALFSTLVADGPLDAAGRERADALEREVRDGVGLD